MNWNGYTVFSVISGVILVIASLVARDVKAKDRFYGIVGGGAFIGYGIFVANQTSGTFFFPIWIFIIPVIAIVYLLVQASGKNRGVSRPASHAHGATAAKAPNGAAAAPVSSAAMPGPGAPPAPPASPEQPAVWSPPPPESTGPFPTDA